MRTYLATSTVADMVHPFRVTRCAFITKMHHVVHPLKMVQLMQAPIVLKPPPNKDFQLESEKRRW